MVASAVQIAKITLLATKRAVALSFGMVLTCNRDSLDKDVVVSFRKLALRVLPCLIHGAASALMCSTNNCPLHGDVVLATQENTAKIKQIQPKQSKIIRNNGQEHMGEKKRMKRNRNKEIYFATVGSNRMNAPYPF
jgi:hypothetical protein